MILQNKLASSTIFGVRGGGVGGILPLFLSAQNDITV